MIVLPISTTTHIIYRPPYEAIFLQIESAHPSISTLGNQIIIRSCFIEYMLIGWCKQTPSQSQAIQQMIGSSILITNTTIAESVQRTIIHIVYNNWYDSNESYKQTNTK